MSTVDRDDPHRDHIGSRCTTPAVRTADRTATVSIGRRVERTAPVIAAERMKPDLHAAGPLDRYARGVKETYATGGATRVVAAAASHLARHTLPDPYDTTTRIRIELLEEALTTIGTSSLPAHRHLDAYRLGFDHQQYRLYGLGRDDARVEDYLSKYARKCARSINDDPSRLKDKERFHTFLTTHGFGARLPERYGTVRNGRFETDDGAGLADLARRHGPFVIKEALGGGGNAVYIGDWDGTGVALRGKGGTSRPVEAVLDDLDRAIVTSYCEQAAYADDIYPDAANTIRILAMHPPDDDPFVAAAAHRIGTSRTTPLDNFSQGSGGLSAEIDVDTGALGTGVTMAPHDEVVRHETHPETGGSIRGIRVPGWESIKEEVLAMTATAPGLRYAGWDVIVTAPGEFVVVEGNHYPGPAVHQVHRPLLSDPRVRAFYDHHGIPI